jgi:hypothetical protein
LNPSPSSSVGIDRAGFNQLKQQMQREPEPEREREILLA